MGDPEWLTIKQTAGRLGLSADQVRRRLRQGKLWTRREDRPHGSVWLIAVAGTRALPAPIEAQLNGAEVGADPPHLQAPDLGAYVSAHLEPLTARLEALAGEAGYWRARAEAAEAQLRQLPAPRRSRWRFWG